MSCEYCGRKFKANVFGTFEFALAHHQTLCKAMNKAKKNIDVVSDRKKAKKNIVSDRKKAKKK